MGVTDYVIGGNTMWHSERVPCGSTVYTISYNFGDAKKSVHIEWVYR